MAARTISPVLESTNGWSWNSVVRFAPPWTVRPSSPRHRSVIAALMANRYFPSVRFTLLDERVLPVRGSTRLAVTEQGPLSHRGRTLQEQLARVRSGAVASLPSSWPRSQVPENRPVYAVNAGVGVGTGTGGGRTIGGATAGA